MVDSSPAVQDEFKQLFECISHHQRLTKPVVILVYSETCPACADAKRNMATLADNGYRERVQFYQLTFAAFQALSCDLQVTHVPTQLLYDTESQRQLWTGIYTEQLENALKTLFAEV
ncbi:thioredoxin domain-containing protein [Pseudomonas wadenswilerensis]|uniref:thioredoxin domain-containing protein n=1 Tax=Pseudomonas TaxID=286 RepID=UPI001F2630A2|nr:thioredoxin domain-containing protein [Pseudomonas sp. LF19]MCE5983335.1 thioredoxin domain-containing protein [Pseudomonas sp. LF19]